MSGRARSNGARTVFATFVLVNELPPSILICEVIDGPNVGNVYRVGARAKFIELRDLFDYTKPRAWYRVVELEGGAVVLRQVSVP
jgi:hypothetical protein